jgi:DNA modification methylase
MQGTRRSKVRAVSSNPLNALLAPADDVIPHLSDSTTAPAWMILHADVRRGLASLAPESVDCVVTSPPYFWQRDYGFDGQIGHEATIADYVTAVRTCFADLRRVLKKQGTFFLNIGDTYYSAKGKPHGRDDKHKGRKFARRTLRAVDGPGLGLPRKSLIGIPWRVALAMQDDGWTLRSDIVWRRPGCLPEPTAQDRPWTTHEHVFLFSNSPRYFFNRAGLDGEEDIWHIVARPDNPGSHFAPYPAALAERCIRSGCRPGGVVLDPFAGSGTTLMTARALGRSAIGIEMSAEYCALMRERLGAHGDANESAARSAHLPARRPVAESAKRAPHKAGTPAAARDANDMHAARMGAAHAPNTTNGAAVNRAAKKNRGILTLGLPLP